MTRRLLVGYLTLTVLVLVILEVPLGISYARRQIDELTFDVERDAVALASLSEDVLEGTQDLDLQSVAEAYQERTGGRVVIVDDQGDVVADSDPFRPGDRSFASRPEIDTALGGGVATGTRRSETLDENLLYVAVPVASGGEVHGAVRITYPTSAVDERVQRNWARLGLVALVTLAAATVVGIVLARSVTRPLRRLQETATRLGHGDLEARTPTDEGPPEVRSLSVAFNDTATRLEQLVTAQEAFVADASHQLRTPLTALRLQLENVREEVGPDEAEEVEAALGEVGRLSRLVDGLLALARAERTSTTVTAEIIDLGALLDERREVWAPVAAEQGVALALDTGDQPVRVLATPDHVAGVVDNLLANALDVSAPGSTVTLSSRSSARDAEAHVVDEGPGLSDDERARAFDRFWTTPSAGRRLGGSGLGLPIARQLARIDGGDLELRAAPTGGIDAVLRLPAAR
ncbi:MAG: HAMP domain-containing protein [Acidimicrobiales bacterium]|nr:HAMP domain-containing protein [Acidimicrobiales bacterium]